jgi:hypothetical protein
MKNVLLVALLMVSVSCGKKNGGKSGLPEFETDPYTGQINLLRATIVSEVFVNQQDRTITILESKMSSPAGDGRFTCPLSVGAGTRWSYYLEPDGRTLQLNRNMRTSELFTRPDVNFNSVLGTWTDVQRVNGISVKTTISFPNVRSMSILQECNRRYYP